MSKRIRFGIFLILLLIIGLAVHGWFNHISGGSPASIKRAEIHIGARDLISRFHRNESISDQEFLYKTLSVSGIIKEVTNAGPHDYTVSLAGTPGLSSLVKCSMDSTFARRAPPLKTGDSVIIRGTCAGRFMDVLLVECILEKQVL